MKKYVSFGAGVYELSPLDNIGDVYLEFLSSSICIFNYSSIDMSYAAFSLIDIIFLDFGGDW
jgi:hypothetical protein